MKRDDFAQPEVKTTDYGAKYIKASTETTVQEQPAVEPEAPAEEPAPVVEPEKSLKDAGERKGKGGRPKKKKA